MSAPLGRMLRHEWRGLVADRTPWLVLGLFGFLLAYAVMNGATWNRIQTRTLDSAAAQGDARLAGLRRSLDSLPADAPPPGPFGRDPRSPASVGGRDGAQYTVLPPQPLAATAVGQSDLLPQYFQVSMRSRQTFANAQEIENPSNLLEGRFDLAFVIGSLFPLLILALSYNLLSAEREQGTLALVASQPVSLGRHLLAKVLVRGGFITAVAIGVALLSLAAAGVSLTGPGAPGRIALWILVVVSYGALWFAAALAANVVPRSSAANAVLLATVWLAVVVVVPAVLNVVVKTIHPVPSRVELISAMRAASNDASARGAALLAKVYGDHPELAPSQTVDAGEFMSRTYAVQDEVDRQIAPVLARFDEQLVRQQQLAERYRFLSPAVLTHAALTDLAGTGAPRYRAWLDQVLGFHHRWQEFFVPRAFRRQWLTPADFDAIPRFSYQAEPDSAVRGRVAIGLLGLAIPTVALLLLAGTRIRRFEVAG